jgi:hypothetical protein
MVSVIIAQRQEPYLRQTCASIVKACGGRRPEILIVNDGAQAKPPDVPKWVRVETPWENPRGCMAARDWGILAAENPTCAIVDGHMDFDDGLFAGYKDMLDANPQDILCAHCPGLNPVTWQRQNHICSGAFFLWQDRPTCLSLKWRYVYDTGEVPAILGACYGINREWYLDGLQRPWQYGTGWGTDEELLSIANWLCGGRNIVTEFDAAHWFREQHQVPYPTDALAIHGSWANRVRMVMMMPMPEDWRAQLLGAIYDSPSVSVIRRQIDLMIEQQPPHDYRKWLEMQQRTFAQWRELWCSNGNPQEANVPKPPGIKTRELPRRSGDKNAGPIPMATLLAIPGTTTMVPFDVVTRKAPQDNPKVADPGIPCPHCRHLYGHKVTHTYPNGNRRRLCHGCGLPFITVRANEST